MIDEKHSHDSPSSQIVPPDFGSEGTAKAQCIVGSDPFGIPVKTNLKDLFTRMSVVNGLRVISADACEDR